ncbi:MAG: hypothetical protein J0M12_05275 [Deltaproteobacteria bacterium]|nr:hypothetical protein [Deltaproteobacteria bacterium]
MALLVAPFFLLSARGRARLWERFGFWNLPRDSYVWFHGASLGEVNGLLPLIRGMRKAFPGARFLLTATSVTGLERGAAEVDQVRLLPFDCSWFFAHAFGQSQCKALIITETELWPALIHEAKNRSAKLCLVNGIISDYSLPWYRRLGPLVRRELSRFDLILCSSETSRQRFVELGAQAATTFVTGNSKYDLQPSVPDAQAARQAKQKFFTAEGPLLVLGSLRPGEEDFWFPELARCIASGQVLNVVVAPRHKEKFEFFAQRLAEFGIQFRRRSEPSAKTECSVVLLDTYGELESVYSFSDVAFVGGSLVDWGGHNPLEPACYGSFVLMGPFARNVKEIVEDLRSAGALRRISGVGDVRRLLEELRNSPQALRERGEKGREVWQSHRGAGEKILARLQEVIR